MRNFWKNHRKSKIHVFDTLFRPKIRCFLQSSTGLQPLIVLLKKQHLLLQISDLVKCALGSLPIYLWPPRPIWSLKNLNFLKIQLQNRKTQDGPPPCLAICVIYHAPGHSRPNYRKLNFWLKSWFWPFWSICDPVYFGRLYLQKGW